jgi:hypothetical protein
LRVNIWQGKTYFNQEAYHSLVSGLVGGVWLESGTDIDIQPLLKEFASAEAKSEYQFDKLAKPTVKKTVKSTSKAKAKDSSTLPKTSKTKAKKVVEKKATTVKKTKPRTKADS